MGCLADAVAGAMVPGHRSDASIVGARLLHNGVGYRSPSATMADIALALDFDVSSGCTARHARVGADQGCGMLRRL
jgi:hypothetical protein